MVKLDARRNGVPSPMLVRLPRRAPPVLVARASLVRHACRVRPLPNVALVGCSGRRPAGSDVPVVMARVDAFGTSHSRGSRARARHTRRPHPISTRVRCVAMRSLRMCCCLRAHHATCVAQAFTRAHRCREAVPPQRNPRHPIPSLAPTSFVAHATISRPASVSAGPCCPVQTCVTADACHCTLRCRRPCVAHDSPVRAGQSPPYVHASHSPVPPRAAAMGACVPHARPFGVAQQLSAIVSAVCAAESQPRSRQDG